MSELSKRKSLNHSIKVQRDIQLGIFQSLFEQQ